MLGEVKNFRKHVYLAWVFKGSALLHINAVVLILFVLAESSKGSFSERSQFLLTYQNWMMVSWISSIVAICSVVATFSILTFSLNRSYLIVLNCAWFISIVAAVIAFLAHFVQMTIIPSLVEWIHMMPSFHLIQYLHEWEHLLTQLFTQIVPICFAISGLFYTTVMFYTRKFPKKLSWWSFSIWISLLFGVIFLNKQMDLFYALLVLFIYVPWLWQVGESLNQILPAVKRGS